jgi:hypothetical protein
LLTIRPQEGTNRFFLNQEIGDRDEARLRMGAFPDRPQPGNSTDSILLRVIGRIV